MPLTPTMQALAWAVVSLFGFVLIFTMLIGPMSLVQQVLRLPLAVTLAAWVLAWVVASGLWALIGARLVFGRWLVVDTSAWLTLAFGALVAAVQIGATTTWTLGRFGYNEPEMVGPTAALFAAIGAVAVAGFGVQVAPRMPILAPAVCVAIGAGLFVAILVDNLPGLTDGLAPDSVGLAMVTAVSTAYVSIVGVVCFLRVRHGLTRRT